MRFALATLALAVSLAACGIPTDLTVDSTEPHPQVLLSPDLVPVKLVLAPTVRDHVTKRTPLVNPVSIEGWRDTLKSGFHNAFPVPGTSGRTLEITAATLSFSGTGVGPHGTASVVAIAHVTARLLDANGAELATLDDSAKAPQDNPTVTSAAMTENAGLAVAAMYEMLVAKLLIPASARR